MSRSQSRQYENLFIFSASSQPLDKLYKWVLQSPLISFIPEHQLACANLTVDPASNQMKQFSGTQKEILQSMHRT